MPVAHWSRRTTSLTGHSNPFFQAKVNCDILAGCVVEAVESRKILALLKQTIERCFRYQLMALHERGASRSIRFS